MLTLTPLRVCQSSQLIEVDRGVDQSTHTYTIDNYECYRGHVDQQVDQKIDKNGG